MTNDGRKWPKLEHRVFQAKPCIGKPAYRPFPNGDHNQTFGDEYANPSVGPHAPSCLAPFRHKPSSHKTLFHKHFCTPRHTTLVASLEQNLCMLPQVPCFGKSCLTLGTRIVLRQFVEIFDQESVIFVNADVHLRHPNLSKREGKYFHEKVPSSSFSYPAIPCWKWFSIKEKWPL